MFSGTRKRNASAYLHNDIRGITIVLLGVCFYLLLFSTFGLPHTSPNTSEATHAFPRKLWQTWKTDAANFDEKMAQRVRSWTKENPTIRYEVLTDANALSYVRHTFGPMGFNRPDIVLAYQDLTATIVKADFLRYLIMYAEGGIYADMDVEAMVPFEEWIPHHFQEQNLDMIIGVETDEPDFKSHQLLGVKAQSFCQWTFVCKQRAPAMLRLINDILSWLNDMKRVQNRDFKDLSFDFNAVLNGTGPSAFTTAILAEMSASVGHNTEWSEFHRLRDAKVVDRILVLPAQAFAASTGHSDSGNHNSMGALVRHHFGASGWTDKHQRYKHPAYGSVEKCNWNPECVKLWDENTAIFDALSQQEQLNFLAEMQTPQNTAGQPQDTENVESEVSSNTEVSKDIDGSDDLPSENIDEGSAEIGDSDQMSKSTNSDAISEDPDQDDDKHDVLDTTMLEDFLKHEHDDVSDATKLEEMLRKDT